jgi:small subunit ribosomal protein S27e
LLFSNAVNKVTCNVCGETLAEPSGGKAKIKGEITAILE